MPGITVDDIPRLDRLAHKKAVAAGAEKMTYSEFWEWAETLPEDEAVAMLVTMKQMQDAQE